jgi:uncharacterized membrane protein YcaP (DUF421 family)
MEWIQYLFEKEDNLNSLQMAARGIIVFLASVLVLRIASKRSFGKESAVDHVVVIILGGMLGRVVTGAAAFLPVMAAVFAIIIMHRLLAWLSLYNKWVGKIVKGEKKLLFSEGSAKKEEMNRSLVSMHDLEEGVRLMLNENNFDNVKEISIERNGEISVVKKDKQQ